MKKLFLIMLLVIAVFCSIAVLLLYISSQRTTLFNPQNQWVYAGFWIFIFPLAALFSQTWVLIMHAKENSKQYHQNFPTKPIYSPHHETDRVIHMLLQFCNDISLGQIKNLSIYTPDFSNQLQSFMQQQQIYRDRGYEIHFQFLYREPHYIQLISSITPTETVIEIQGQWDLYIERAGQRYPMIQNGASPQVNVSGGTRLHLLYDEENHQWRIAGFADTVLQAQIGLSVT